MRKRNAKAAKQAAVGFLSAAILFSSIQIDAFAKEANGLPSAGVDFILSSDATSVKSLKEEKESQNADTAATASPSPSATPEASSTPTAIASLPSALPTATAGRVGVVSDSEEEIIEEKIIEETMMATTDKTVKQMDRQLENKREEESFKSLVIAKVNDYVNVRSIPSEEGEILGKLYD